MPPIKKSKTGLVLAVIGGLVILAIVGVVEFGGQEGLHTPALTAGTPAPSLILAPAGAQTAPSDRAGANAPSPPGAAPASSGSDNSPNARYRFLGKDQDIVEDIRTKLQWQRCSLGQTWNGVTCTGEGTSFIWGEARRAVPAGWRLPTKEELASLIYCSSGQPAYWKTDAEPCEGVYTSPTVWDAAFPNTPGLWFWSCTTYAYVSCYAWSVNLDSGIVYRGSKEDAGYVRLVRNGQ